MTEIILIADAVGCTVAQLTGTAVASASALVRQVLPAALRQPHRRRLLLDVDAVV
ncbi:hypothetical protein ACFS27_14045 [Promicromonospora vindobonensis]|uniref:Uncharacterized protein n=1 Tax=Promicromonospora vindobonensis TaxID=195748 RepID=A0ABW5VVW3_9MICO